MHPLFSRQLKKLGLTDQHQLPNEAQWHELQKLVSRSYHSADDDRTRLERSLDVSSIEMLQRTQEISHIAFHDKLTNLPNRALFLDRVEVALNKSKRQRQGNAVLFLDLDNFKIVNDSLGHEAGDKLLIAVSSKLQECVRPGDTVARIGGDEFTILLEDLSHCFEAKEIADKILDILRIPVSINHNEIVAGASIGIAYTEEDNECAENLIKNADLAMYSAKSKGKYCADIFEPYMNDLVNQRLEIETRLRKALEMNELHVQYQPLYCLVTKQFIGAEALCRWTNPVLGSISPAQFIPVAEEAGLINTIGYWVLETACATMRTWMDRYDTPDLVISVNVSGRQLQTGDTAQKVAEILARTNLPAQNLKLEITESILMADRVRIASILHELRDMGVKLAIDDFGTGYSSLATLSSFPINTLKIDRSFISRLEEEKASCEVIKAIVALSTSLNLDITCEGIETVFQEDYLRALGCQTGQGYLFSKPLLTQDFENMIEASLTAKSKKNKAAA
jgi:diguanylate cyclase (GGDEF)-like protein